MVMVAVIMLVIRGGVFPTVPALSLLVGAGAVLCTQNDKMSQISYSYTHEPPPHLQSASKDETSKHTQLYTLCKLFISTNSMVFDVVRPCMLKKA